MDTRSATEDSRGPCTARCLALAVSGCLAGGAQAQDALIDMREYQRPAGWECRWCPREQGVSGEVEAGVGTVSESSAKFGQYTGLQDEGPYAIAGASAEYRGSGAEYADLEATRLGIDSRQARAAGGEQGQYRVGVEYVQIPDFATRDSRIPFVGGNDEDLRLPEDWVPAPSTEQMTSLDQSLHTEDLKQERKRWSGGLSYVVNRNWELTASLSHEHKAGTKSLGGAIGPSFGSAQATLLPEPVDYDTNQVDLAAAYTRSKFQAQFGYYGSFFNDKNDALRWQNPFVAAEDPTGSGQLALPPDNEFHQIYARAGYDLLQNTRAMAFVSLGRMTQDEDFLPFTVNPTLERPLPRSSPDAKVDALLVDLKLSSRPLPRLRTNLQYKFSDRDNDTPRTAYDYVVADSAPAPAPRTNLPYSFQQRLLQANAGYSLPHGADLSVGYDDDRIQRTLQEVNQTREGTVWGRLELSPHPIVDASLDLSHSDRSNSNYRPLEEVSPPQNPLMRKFYMADRDRKRARGFLGLSPSSRWGVGVSAELADDNYSHSPIGLTDARDTGYTLELNFAPVEVLSTYAYYARQKIKSEQAGSSSFSTPNWFADSRDRFDNVGAGLKWEAIRGKLDVGADYVYARSKGKIDVSSTLLETTPFPDLSTRLNSIGLWARYRLDKSLAVRLGYLYEKYDSRDWALDGVEPDTIPNVLSMGVQSPDYSVNVYTLSILYSF